MKRNIIINSDVLRKTRKSMEISQEDMAKGLGVTRKTYARYETERALISEETVSKISDLLSVGFDELVLLDMNAEIERIKEYPNDKLMKRLFKYAQNAD